MKYKQCFHAIVYFLLGFIIVLLFGEAYLRITKVVTPAFNYASEELGRARRPDLFWVMFNEGFGMGSFNRYGYLGPAYSPVKPVSVVRVALMGDSFVEGFQVFDRDHFRSMLETNLSNETTGFEVMNFGRSGFNLRDCFVYHVRFVDKFKPDVSVVFLSSEDLWEPENDGLLPSVAVDEDSITIIDKPSHLIQKYRNAEVYLQHSYFLNMLNSARKKAKNVPVGSVLFDKFYVGKAKVQGNSEMERPLERKELNKKLIAQLGRQTNLIVVDKTGDLDDWFKVYCASEGIPVIAFESEFNKSGLDAYQWKTSGKRGHWNHEAHAIVAEVLGRKIKEVIFAH